MSVCLFLDEEGVIVLKYIVVWGLVMEGILFLVFGGWIFVYVIGELFVLLKDNGCC